MNLITAVMVNSAIDKAEHNKAIANQAAKEKAAQFSRNMKSLFWELDKDGSSTLSREEFADISGDSLMLLSECLPDMTPMEVFEAIDVDNIGSIDIEEFCQGVIGLVKSGLSPAMRRLGAQLEATHMHIKNVSSDQDRMLLHFGLPLRRGTRSAMASSNNGTIRQPSGSQSSAPQSEPPSFQAMYELLQTLVAERADDKAPQQGFERETTPKSSNTAPMPQLPPPHWTVASSSLDASPALPCLLSRNCRGMVRAMEASDELDGVSMSEKVQELKRRSL